MKKKAFILVGIFLFSTLTTMAQPSPISSFQNDDALALYRITPALRPTDLPQQATLMGGKPQLFHDVLMNKQDILSLQQQGYHVELLEKKPFHISQEIINQYHTFEEIESILETIANDHPDITNLYSIGKSIEDRDLWCLEITDNPGISENEPGVFYMGLHHAREWPTIEICLQLAEYLTANYEENATIKNLVNNRRIWIVPCVNPDGYIYDHDLYQGERWWRKNRHYFKDSDVYGVDLNRNYPGSCDGDSLGMWGSTGMSHDPSSNVYCGSKQFSEPETNAVKNLFLTQDICASISYHTYGELVMWPWGHSIEKTTTDDARMTDLGIRIAENITSQDGSGTYTPTQSAGLYPTCGDTTDWVYGYHHYVLGKPHFSYTIEACKSFHPDASVLSQVCQENIDGALVLLQEADYIHQLTPRVVPPIIADITENQDQTSTIRWNNVNPASQPTAFELQEYFNMQYNHDDAETSSTNLILDDFSVTTNKAYSGLSSYHSHTKDNMVSSLTTAHPLFVNQSMDLSFYCWYEIEQNYDMAFVEISIDGKNYEVIDTFTGSSTDWTKRSYSLDPYLGKSVYIRFRYATDSRKTEEGFYVDDLFPIACYETITTIDNSITEQQYTLSSREETNYFYRVRGYNDAYGWGDFSMLKPLHAITVNNTAPHKPTISGSQRAQAGTVCSYEIQASDAENHQLYYYVSWGDGETEDWIGPFPSDETQTITHVWDEKGRYTIEVRVKDVLDAKSEWTQLHVAMPQYNHQFSFSDLVHLLLQHFGLPQF
ncbi:MAG: M14 family zinc carboxypeptidase [Thermoplasmatota archaeon]